MDGSRVRAVNIVLDQLSGEAWRAEVGATESLDQSGQPDPWQDERCDEPVGPGRVAAIARIEDHWYVPATDRQLARPARWLAVHAVLIGVGWVPLAFAFWFLVGVDPGTGVVPDWMLGAVGLVCAMFVVPLLWPALIALGWFESGLAERMASGDRGATQSATWTLRGLGLAFCMVGVAAATVASAAGDVWWDHHEFVVWAWTGPVALGVLHLALAHMLSHRRNRVRCAA